MSAYGNSPGQTERRKTNPYEVIAEKVYWISFAFTLFLIVVGTIVTAIFRKTVSPDIVIIPKEILDFTEHILWVFALPVSLKIGGDALPMAIAAWKGGSTPLTNQSMQGGYGQTGSMGNSYNQSDFLNPSLSPFDSALRSNAPNAFAGDVGGSNTTSPNPNTYY